MQFLKMPPSWHQTEAVAINAYLPDMPAEIRTAVVTQSIASFWKASGELDSILNVSPDIT